MPYTCMLENSFYNKRVLRILRQTGRGSDIIRDKGRGASLPGKRISKNGKEYWETRKNRSDDYGKKI